MKIMFISNSLKSNSGFSQLTRHIAIGLKNLGHDVSISGFQTAEVPEYIYGIKHLPLATKYSEQEQFIENIMITDPDIVIYIGEPYSSTFNLSTIFPITIVYLVLEGQGLPIYVVNNIKNIQKRNSNFKIISTCKYAQQQFKNYGIDTDMIYPGYDKDVFYPIDKKDIEQESKYCYYSTQIGQESLDPRILCKTGCYCCNPRIHDIYCNDFYQEELISFTKFDKNKNNKNDNKGWLQIEDLPISKLKNELKNKFTYLFIGQNHQLRKRIELLLQAYSILIKDSRQLQDNTHLHLHCKPQSPTGIDLLEIANRLNIQENISFSYGTWRSSGLSDQALNILYNLADVQVSASSSESPGLPTFEGFATGLPIIAPDNTSFTELITDYNKKIDKNVNQRGMLTNIDTYHMIQDLTSRALVNPKDLASKMDLLYHDKSRIPEYSKNALEFIKPLTWGNQVKKWDDLLNVIQVKAINT